MAVSFEAAMTADEVNVLVYRYLQESGLGHSAFVFANESLLGSSLPSTAQLPPGSLLLLLHKGLLYEQLERQVRRPEVDGSEAKRVKTVVATMPVSVIPASADSKSLVQLKGHTQSCFVCAWGSDDVLASGGGDASARLWKEGEQKSVLSMSEGADVTSLAWDAAGSVLATASTDGKVRLWSAEGSLTATLEHHSGSVFAVDFADGLPNLLSVGQDATVAIWNLESHSLSEVVRDVHSGPVLDGRWQPGSGSAVFATCGSDGSAYIHFYQKSSAQALQLAGHVGDVNGVVWSPDGRHLATCSHDHTARLWAFTGEAAALAHELRGHTREVYAVKWSPATSGKRAVATSSLDASVKLWDADTGGLLHSLTLHQDCVYGLAFDPSGERLCSGGFDAYCHVWNVADGSLIKSVKTSDGVFYVAWNRRGDKVSASLANGVVVVCDI